MMLYGPEFATGSPVFIGIMFATGISAVGSIAGTSIAAMDRMWVGLGLNMIWGVVFLVVLSQLAPELGANAYAFSFSVAYIVLFSLTNWYQKEKMLHITFVRIFISGAYLLGVSILCLFTPHNWRLIMILPVLIISVVFSYKIFGVEWNDGIVSGLRKDTRCN
jgi:O-antigen/teichoic acid export membrane protein